jgi:transposase
MRKTKATSSDSSLLERVNEKLRFSPNTVATLSLLSSKLMLTTSSTVAPTWIAIVVREEFVILTSNLFVVNSLDYTGKKQKPMQRVVVPYATAPRMRQKMLMDRNNRQDKRSPAEREKKAKSELIPSVRSCQRHLRKSLFNPRSRPWVPFARENLPVRYSFCKNKDFLKEDFVKQIHFSDEHWIDANDRSHRFMWVQNKNQVVPREKKSKHNTYCSQLWAMIGYDYKSPLIWIDFKPSKKKPIAKNTVKKPVGRPPKNPKKPVGRPPAKKTTKKAKKAPVKKKPATKKKPADDDDEEDEEKKKKKNRKTLDGPNYIKHILKHPSVFARLTTPNVILMQDGATSHKCKLTKAFLRRSKIRFIEDWPSHSPDLNPIEQVWALLNQRMSENRRNVPSSIEELRRAAEEEWAAIDQATINNYVMSFVSKCRRVVSRKGGSAKK